MSSKLHVSDRELKKGFERLLNAAQPELIRAGTKGGGRMSASALLLGLYALECGLKRWLLLLRGVSTTLHLSEDELTHDLNHLFWLVQQRHELPPNWNAEIPKGEKIPVVRLHELYRYGGQLADTDERRLAQLVLDLSKIVQENINL